MNNVDFWKIASAKRKMFCDQRKMVLDIDEEGLKGFKQWCKAKDFKSLER